MRQKQRHLDIRKAATKKNEKTGRSAKLQQFVNNRYLFVFKDRVTRDPAWTKDPTRRYSLCDGGIHGTMVENTDLSPSGMWVEHLGEALPNR